MAMIRYNIHIEDKKLKSETCMFDGSVIDISAMMANLIDRIYTSEFRLHGKKGLEIIHKVIDKVPNMVYNEIVDDYLKGGQDENRDLEG